MNGQRALLPVGNEMSRKENAMKSMPAILLSLIVTASRAYAAGGATGGEEFGLFTIGFISLGVLILLFQFVPVLLLVVGMVGAMLKNPEKKSKIELASAGKIA